MQKPYVNYDYILTFSLAIIATDIEAAANIGKKKKLSIIVLCEGVLLCQLSSSKL